MSIDNPTYFCSQDESMPNTPTSPSRKFSFFRRRSSSSNKLLPTLKTHNGGGGGASELPPSGFSLTTSSSMSSTATSAGAHHRHPKSFLNSSKTNSSKNHNQQNFESTDELDNGNATHIFFGNQKPNNHNDKRNKYRERLGSYNETFSYTINDDVFCSNTSSNRSTTYNGYPDDSNESVSETRRHSIGTFQSKEQRIRSTSFSDEVPTMPAPKAPVTLPNMRKRRENMDDILVVTTKHSEHGHIWSNKLKACFDNITKQRGRLPFNFLNVKIDDGPISTDVSYRSKQTKLQIVIICPVLLSLPGSYIKSQLSEVIKPNIALAMFLDIPEEQIMEIHKNIFPCFYQWKRVVVQSSDQSPLSELVGTAVDILGRALREQPLCTEIATPSVGLKGNHDHFTVIPRKVRTGQNKIVAILTEPLTMDDSYRVRIEKSGEVIDVQNVKKRNPYTLQLTVPESCLEVSTMIGIRIEKNGADLGSKPVKCESRLKEMELILKSQNSPVKFMCHSLGLDNSGDIEKLDLYLVQSFQKNVPPNFDLLASLNEKGNFYSYKEARPEEFPTLLHFAAKYGFEKLCLQLVEFPGGVIACDIRNSAGKTPEEIAEDERHLKISSYLKCFAQMHRITTMYDYVAGMNDALNQSSDSKSISNTNLNTETPKDAENLDSDDIKKINQTTEEYMQMNGSGSDTDCTDLGKPPKLNNNDSNHNLNYAKLQINSSSGEDEFSVMTNELKITEPSYYDSNEINLKADPLSQECSNLLENYQSEYLVQPSNIPVMDSNALNEYENNENGFGDYLVQPSNIPVIVEQNTNCKPNISGDYLTQPSNIKVDHSIPKTEQKQMSSSLKRQGSNLSKTSSADDELLEIINDFKNNVFTIQEVEQLVASWKNRNDVQQSFKDKQDQLQKMREEYDKIQNRIKEKLKRPTPFERMKKIFSWGKPVNTAGSKDGSHNTNGDTVLEMGSAKSSSYNRPMSSLSLQSVSSSSSGRMSTASGCSGASLGDSGTHSDHEERRHAFSTSSNSPNCRIGSPGSLLDNYMIPPVPRPISTPSSTPTPHEEKDRPIYPIRSSVMSTSSEHYILFPSNVPVSQTCSNSANQYINIEQHNYANFSGLHTITETPNEMCITLQPIKIQKQYNNDIINNNNEKLLTSFKSSINHNNNNFNNCNFEKQYNKNPNIDGANNNNNNSCSSNNYENL